VIKEPTLSIIVTSYSTQRLNDIYELLDSIKAQTYSHIETVFVAEQSKELYDLVQDYAQEKAIPNFKLIFNDGEKGASAARNLGIQQARGEIIAFVDDDALPFPDWAEEMVKTYADASIIGVTGPAFPLWEDENDAWLPEELHWLISCTSWADNETRKVRNIWLQNGSFRREAFDRAGFLNPGLGPQDSTQGFKGREIRDGIISEEVDISLRIIAVTKKYILYNPAVRVKHRVNKKRLKPAYIRRWSYWMGLSKRKVKKLHLQTDKSILAPEQQLLKRIFTRLFPDILKALFTHPVIAWRKLKVTMTALFFVALGYYGPLFKLSWAGNKQNVNNTQKGV